MAPRTTDRSYISRVNNTQGRLMEDMIMGAAMKYEREGRLVLHKESEPFRVVKNMNRARGRAEVQFTAKAQPDFVGCLRGGRLIAIEAKYTQSDMIKQDVRVLLDSGVTLIMPDVKKALAYLDLRDGDSLLDVGLFAYLLNPLK